MCARITIHTTATEIADIFGLSHDIRHAIARARFNVAPSQAIPVLRLANGVRELADLRWGLIPHWNTDPQHAGYVNARSETAAEKPAFRDSFRRRRCLIPTDGFFEWKQIGKKKHPYYFRAAGGGMFVFAGVWDRWMSDNGPIDTVAVLTVAANDIVRPLHDRMPAIMSEHHFDAWLNPVEIRPTHLLSLLEPYPAERMERWPVSARVNSVAVDDPGVLNAVPEPRAPMWTQPSLFDVS